MLAHFLCNFQTVIAGIFSRIVIIYIGRMCYFFCIHLLIIKLPIKYHITHCKRNVIFH